MPTKSAAPLRFGGSRARAPPKPSTREMQPVRLSQEDEDEDDDDEEEEEEEEEGGRGDPGFEPPATVPTKSYASYSKVGLCK